MDDLIHGHLPTDGRPTTTHPEAQPGHGSRPSELIGRSGSGIGTRGAYDPGLGGATGSAAQLGKFRTPTTRNVAVGVNRTYMHNGVLKSLKQVVDFYNTRDVLRRCTAQEIATLHPSQYGSYDPDGAGPLTAAGCWPSPEYAQNMDTKQMGALGLTEAQVNAIVAYLRAMSDR